jgi:hypothetical protein
LERWRRDFAALEFPGYVFKEGLPPLCVDVIPSGGFFKIFFCNTGSVQNLRDVLFRG